MRNPRSLEDQVLALRRQNRVFVLLFAAVLCAAMVAPRQDAQGTREVLRADRVEAKEFLIRDDKGVRANLLLQDDGAIALYLRDARGVQRVALLAQKDGLAGVVVHDDKGRERVSTLSHAAGSGLYLMDHEDRERLSLVTQPDEMAGIFLMDTGKRECVSAVSQIDGVAGIVVRATDGEPIHSFVR